MKAVVDEGEGMLRSDCVCVLQLLRWRSVVCGCLSSSVSRTTFC